MAMNKMLDVRVEAEAMLLALSCAAFYVKGETKDPVMMDFAKKIKGVSDAVDDADIRQPDKRAGGQDRRHGRPDGAFPGHARRFGLPTRRWP